MLHLLLALVVCMMFLHQKPKSLTKRVYNITGTSTAFVRVEILEIDADPKMNQRESAQKEIKEGSLTQERLIVSPLRLIIPPSSFQSVRILWPGDSTEKRTLFF